MGLFNKKNKESKKEEVPALPDLPKLPEFPKIKGENPSTRPIHQLPSFPTNSLGEKFSQDTIKEAVTGEKEGEEVSTDDFAEEEQMMLKPQKKTLTKEIPSEFLEASRRVKKAEPVFIRLDKFEEGLHLFEKAKKQISEIEEMLKDIKRIKEKEEEELGDWEKEIQLIKEQIERVDKDIFSKIE